MAKNNNDNRNALTQNLNEFSLKIVCDGSTDNSYAMPHGKSTAESTTVQFSTVQFGKIVPKSGRVASLNSKIY